MDGRRLRVLALAGALVLSAAPSRRPSSVDHGVVNNHPIPAALQSPRQRPVSAAAGCLVARPIIAPVPARIDSLLAVRNDGTALALTGPPWSRLRYLPHDDLMLLASDGVLAWRATLPPYDTPPGLAVGNDGATIEVVVDSAVLLLDPATGRLRARRRLDMQAVGWPAAVVAGAAGQLYAAGQPNQGWEAVVEDLSITARGGQVHVAWRTKLGLFHAGIWLGHARPGYLAVYLPGAYDAPGMVALLDERGALGRGYAVPAPPLAADPAHNRLYLDDAGTIRVLALDSGRPVAATSGQAPLAVIPRRGLVAFAQGNGVTLATATTLRPIAHLALSGVTALAVTPNGTLLLVGLRGFMARVALGGCQ